jgi:phosphatidylglycerophosphate synthase
VGLRPNQISILSVVFAALAAGCLLAVPSVSHAWGKVALYLAAAVCIPMRLLCNMFDGMVAVEGGFRTRVGDLYNELPDRVSDVLVLVAAGYSTALPSGILLGWISAVLAVMTAYVRALGGVAGSVQPFCGPMAKQQRMVTVVTVSVLSVGEILFACEPRAMMVGLVVLAVGTFVTAVRRTVLIARDLEAK